MGKGDRSVKHLHFNVFICSDVQYLPVISHHGGKWKQINLRAVKVVCAMKIAVKASEEFCLFLFICFYSYTLK